MTPTLESGTQCMVSGDEECARWEVQLATRESVFSIHDKFVP
jgi:hypothetical protein